MTEYYVHILNWSIEAESPEEAAKEAHLELGCILTGMNPVLTITDSEGELIPDWVDAAEKRDLFCVRKEFDSEIWQTEEENEKRL